MDQIGFFFRRHSSPTPTPPLLNVVKFSVNYGRDKLGKRLPINAINLYYLRGKDGRKVLIYILL